MPQRFAQFSLHELVSGVCSQPGSCGGIKIFHRKLSKPAFTNKVHISAVIFYSGVFKNQNNGKELSKSIYVPYLCLQHYVVMQKQPFADVHQNRCSYKNLEPWRHQHRCFPVNMAKNIRKTSCKRLLLMIDLTF